MPFHPAKIDLGMACALFKHTHLGEKVIFTLSTSQ
jgi:hypothetical protein